MKRILFIMGMMVLSSCEIPSAETSDFAFLEVNVTTLNGGFSGFTDVWFSRDGQLQGVYELPRTIPVIVDSPSMGVIRPGIRENGIKSSPRVYPFIKNFDISINLDKDETRILEPNFEYLSQVKFRLDADFEANNPFGFDEDGIDSIRLVQEMGIGKLKLRAGETLEEATLLVYDELPKNGSPIYLEIEYKGNVDLDVGLIGISGTDAFKEYFVSLRSENEWKKAYINFTELIVASNLNGYQVVLGADNTDNNFEAEIYVDNIKLLHF